MASFGIEQTEVSPTPSASTVQKPVQKTPAGLGVVSSIFDQIDTSLENLGKAKGQKTLAAFSEQQLKVIQALDQGVQGYTSEYARAQLRLNLKNAIVSHPSMVNDLLDLNAKLLGTAGMGQIVTEGTKQEILAEQERNRLVEQGYITVEEAADPAKVDLANKYRADAADAKRRYDQEMETLNMREKQGQVVDSERKRLAARTVGDTAPMLLQKFNTEIETTIANPDMNEADKVKYLETLYAQGIEEMTPYLSQMDPAEASSWTKLFEQRRDIALKRASGEYSDNQAKKELERLGTTAKLEWMKDETFAKVYALSNLMQENPSLAQGQLIQRKLDEVILRSLEGNEVDPTAKDTDSEKAQRQLFDMMEKADSASTESQVEIDTHIKNILQGAADMEGKIARDPAAVKEFVHNLSRPSVAAFIQRNPEAKALIAEVAPIIQQHYANEVWKLIQKELIKNNVPITPESFDLFEPNSEYPTAPANSLVNIQTSDNGVTFVPYDNNIAEAKSLAKRLNKTLSPIINETVMAMSHLNGNTSYKATADEVLKTMTEGTGIVNDEGDDLVIDDFQNYLESEESMGGVVGNVTDAGKGYTVVRLDDGSTERRTGSRAWRNNNPGNIEYGSFARSQGAVGSDGRFAVFPSYEAGRAAKESLLFDSKGYKNKTIAEAIARYAPAFENDSAAYARTIARAAGVPVTTLLSELSPDQRQVLLSAMESVEGFKPGKSERIDNASG